MKTIQIISQDVFDKIRSRFQNLEMGDEMGAVTLDPAQARFFDFDFIYEGTKLGRVSISLADLGTLKLYYSQDITEDQDDTSKQIWYDFLREMRQFAKRRLLRFDTRDIAKTNLDKEDFQHLAASQQPKEQDAMSQTMNESRWTKRTPKTSRVIKDGTQIIVRHPKSMEEVHPSQLSRESNVESIFVQNKLGERFKCPFNNLDLALALGQHVDHGGVPHDEIGRKIILVAEEIAQLEAFRSKIKRANLHDDALQIQEKAIGRLSELRQHLRSLSKRRNYKSWVETLANESPKEPLLIDQVTLEDYKAKFTQTSFIEGLEEYFPLLHKIMQEANTIDLEDLVSEEEKAEHDDFPFTGGKPARGTIVDKSGAEHSPMSRVKHAAHQSIPRDNVKNSIPKFEQFEEWADELIEDETSAYPSEDQINRLKEMLSDPSLKDQLPTDNLSAYEFFNANGFQSKELEERFNEASEAKSTVDPLIIFKRWLEETNVSLFKELKDLLPAEESTEPQAPVQPSQTQPPKAPVQQPQARQSTPAENTEMTMPPGVMAEEKSKKMLEKIAEMVKTEYNGDNLTVGAFRNEEGILMDVEKEFGEKGRIMAEAIIEKLKERWEEKRSRAEMEQIRHLSGLKK